MKKPTEKRPFEGYEHFLYHDEEVLLVVKPEAKIKWDLIEYVKLFALCSFSVTLVYGMVRAAGVKEWVAVSLLSILFVATMGWYVVNLLSKYIKVSESVYVITNRRVMLYEDLNHFMSYYHKPDGSILFEYVGADKGSIALNQQNSMRQKYKKQVQWESETNHLVLENVTNYKEVSKLMRQIYGQTSTEEAIVN